MAAWATDPGTPLTQDSHNQASVGNPQDCQTDPSAVYSVVDVQPSSLVSRVVDIIQSSVYIFCNLSMRFIHFIYFTIERFVFHTFYNYYDRSGRNTIYF